MKYIIALYLLLSLSQYSFSQDVNFEVNDYTVNVINSELQVFKNDTLIYSKKFSNPFPASIDLDNDGMNELQVIDSTISGETSYYTFYIYSTLDSFFLADSIYSGITQPYETESEDVASENDEAETAEAEE